MKKKVVFALTIALLATLVIAAPAFAFSGIQFTVYDAVSLQPWGTSDGQSYRIYVWGSVNGMLMDTGTLTTPGDPVLNATCVYSDTGNCFGTTLDAPDDFETVTVYIILTGTTGNPSTIIKSYQQPPADLGNYIISENSGTGPNVVTLAGANTESPNVWLPVALAVVALVSAGGVVLLLRRRRIA